MHGHYMKIIEHYARRIHINYHINYKYSSIEYLCYPRKNIKYALWYYNIYVLLEEDKYTI